jgi:hypothetical protein
MGSRHHMHFIVRRRWFRFVLRRKFYLFLQGNKYPFGGIPVILGGSVCSINNHVLYSRLFFLDIYFFYRQTIKEMLLGQNFHLKSARRMLGTGFPLHPLITLY